MDAHRVIRPHASRLQAEPNITPLIDVLLVLLIIFLTTLPLTQTGLDATIPQTVERSPVEAPPASIVLEYTADRRMTINHQAIDAGGLEARLRDVFRERVDKTLYIAGDGSLRYGDIIQVIDAAKGAGVERVGVITEAMRRGGAGEAR